MALVQQGIANGTSHQRQTTVALKPHLLGKSRRQLRGNAWKRQRWQGAHRYARAIRRASSSCSGVSTDNDVPSTRKVAIV